MAAKPKPDTLPARDMVLPAAITVTAPGGPRRRAGMRFDTQPKVLQLADLNDDQIAALQSDPMLSIRAEPAPEIDEDEAHQGG